MAENTKLSAFILLDRSSSMSGARWENAIASINKYVDTLKTDKVDADITLAAFDYHGTPQPNYAGIQVGGLQMRPIEPFAQQDGFSFTVLRDKANIKKFKTLQPGEVAPRGSTPLYDATARLINMADSANNEKTVIIIMTDGEENCSRQYNLSSIRDRIATCQKRGWEVLFLGAEFNADHIASSYGLAAGKVINTSLRNMDASMSFMAASSTNYTRTGEAIDTLSVKDKMAKSA
jgi:uncharacterized protein YegL